MKSWQVAAVHQDEVARARYSDLKVCRSRTGYFIGTTYKDGTSGSRDSDYFAKEADAIFALELLVRMWSEVCRIHLGAGHAEPNTEVVADFLLDWQAALTVCGLDPRDVGYRLEP